MSTEEMRQYLKNIEQVALKNRVWYIGAVVLSALAVICVMLFYQPKIKIDSSAQEASMRQIKALELQSAAFQNLVAIQAKRIEEFASRDSVLLSIGLTNKANILKIKTTTNEKIKAFDSYGSSDWTLYFSRLPEPEGQLSNQ